MRSLPSTAHHFLCDAVVFLSLTCPSCARLREMSAGKIDYHELKVAMRALGFATQEEGEIDEEIARMMADLDGDGKGSINFDEFLEAVTTKAAASGASVFDGTGAARDEAAGGATARDLAQRLEEAKVQRLVAAVTGAPGPAALDSHSLVE